HASDRPGNLERSKAHDPAPAGQPGEGRRDPSGARDDHDADRDDPGRRHAVRPGRLRRRQHRHGARQPTSDGSRTVPTDTGGVPLTSYVVTPYLGTVAQTPMVVSGSPPATTTTFDGLPHGTYTFTVAAANYGATSSPSAPSSAVEVFSVPGQPSDVKAVQNPDGVQISWTAPVDDGGKSITSYAVETGNGSFVASTTGATSVLVTSGLVDGQGYSFVVGASNAVGAGPNSLPSPVFYPFTGGSYHPLQPIRIMDTRDGTGGYARAPLGPNSYTTVQLIRCGCLPASGVSAVVLNVTVTN